MNTEISIPESDRAKDAPHPRETLSLLGQSQAENRFLQAFDSGRLHHAWMISGPVGIGKATLAWRIARFLLCQANEDMAGLFAGAPNNPNTLDTDPSHPVVRRTQSLGEPRLFLCRIPWDEKAKRLKSAISVEEVRKLKSFFNLSAADGGWRVAIIDAADQLTRSAANALLKILEEPPEKVVIILISHQPSKLLPTIRSRCRDLRCSKLSQSDQMTALHQAGFEVGAEADTLSILSDGSVGTAIRLINSEGVILYKSLVSLAATAPSLDRATALPLADKCTGRDAAARYDVTVQMISLLLARLAIFGALQPPVWTEAAPGEALMLAKLAPNAACGRKWADLAQSLTLRVSHARAVNLDPSSVILDMLLKLNETARN
ncbi:MAG: DNA polymerase III subunit delta' [Rhodobacteraceae bacterium]|nr:DNA polymerase III subunit delta' [Paracoccaceae bacterium]